jgi:hypothetical protein
LYKFFKIFIFILKVPFFNRYQTVSVSTPGSNGGNPKLTASRRTIISGGSFRKSAYLLIAVLLFAGFPALTRTSGLAVAEASSLVIKIRRDTSFGKPERGFQQADLG